MTTFMSIPFEYDSIDRGRKSSIEQWGMDKFQEMVQPILDAGAWVRWSQYTPYFNDGDICEFGVNDPRFSLGPVDEDDEGGDYQDGFYDLYDYALSGGEEEVYKGQVQDGYEEYAGRRFPKYKSVYEKTGRIFERHPAYESMKSLSKAIDHFEDLLYDTFGDHATVTLTPEKVIKEYYEHE